jgi:hypothetical protein
LASIGARGDHGGIAPTSAQINLGIVAKFLKIGIRNSIKIGIKIGVKVMQGITITDPY